jgi:hypothetical protein
MSTEQVNRFIRQVKERQKTLDILSIMGGEPTVHPKMEEITLLLFNQLKLKGYVNKLRIATNGINPIPDSIKNLPIEIITSPPAKKEHRCQFIAPKDIKQKMCFCEVPYTCGIALNYFGYFPCGAGGAITRLFKLTHLIRYELPDSVEDFGDFEVLCKLCQKSALKPVMLRDHNPDPSVSFQKAIKNYEKAKPSYRSF